MILPFSHLSTPLNLEVELILDELVDVPALALPVRTLPVAGLYSEPVKVRGFSNLNVLDQRLKLLHSKGTACAFCRAGVYGVQGCAQLGGLVGCTPTD
jgi:hypothetical protein